jgi:DNA-binding CsgD family transcriptional regulator
MKLDYPYKAATTEEDATVLPHPDRLGCSSSPHRHGRCAGECRFIRNLQSGRHPTKSPGYQALRAVWLQRWDGASVPKENRVEPSPLSKTRESACPRGCRECFLAQQYGLTPRVILIALTSSGQSSRTMSRTLGIRITTIRECYRTIHRKIGPHSRLAIGLWAIREGMLKCAIQP